MTKKDALLADGERAHGACFEGGGMPLAGSARALSPNARLRSHCELCAAMATGKRELIDTGD
jgi:hypothetical protein